MTFGTNQDSLLFENLMEGFQVISYDWRYLYINEAAAQHGRSDKESLTGRKMTEVYPGIEHTEMFRRLKQCMVQRTYDSFENRFNYEDGTHRWFKICITPVNEGLIVLSLDITAIKQTEESLNDLYASLEDTIRSRTSELQLKNKEITDNLNYARRIQDVLLPDKHEFRSKFEDSFVLYKPKDIVSGDFYYLYQDYDYTYIAAADCTGHGVSGALMSMLGHEKLEESMMNRTDPGAILSALNQGMRKTLRQKEGKYSNLDGMDIALCAVDRINRTIKYSGANRPLWIIRKDSHEVEVIKSTRQSIGGLTAGTQHFESHIIQLNPGDSFYIFTDGYTDAMSKCGKRIKTGLFKKFLLKIHERQMQEQESMLDRFVHRWISGFEQLDDILVIGVRL